jgi:hypothetical protein
MRSGEFNFAAIAAVAGRLAMAAVVLGTFTALAADKVTFSDSNKSKDPADVAKPASKASRSFQNPFESTGPKGSSLQGVTAPPFSPSAPSESTPSPLTARERQMLEDRRDWIMRTPGNGSYSERDVNRALGVKEYDAGANASKSADKGWLMRYYEQGQSSKNASTKGLPETMRTQPMGLESSGRNGNRSLTTKDSANWSQSGERALDMQESVTGLPGGLEKSAADHDWMQASRMGSAKSPRFDAPRNLGLDLDPEITGPNALQGQQLQGITKILGRDPIQSTLPSSASLLDTGLGSVNAYPDSTRNALNPVVAKPAADNKVPFQPGFAAGERPEKSLQLKSSAVLDGLGANSYFAPVPEKPADVPLVQQRGVHSMKTQIEMPRRSH